MNKRKTDAEVEKRLREEIRRRAGNTREMMVRARTSRLTCVN